MKKLIFAMALVALADAASAQEAGQFGAGAVLGSPIGVTGKLWLDGTKAIAVGLGSSEGNFTAWGDLQLHGWNILPQPAKGKLGLYCSLGGRLEAEEDSEFGLRTLGGIAYWFGDRPIELFAEMGPAFEFGQRHGDEVDIDGGLGVRFYFGGPATAKK